MAPRVSGALILNQIDAVVSAFGRETYERALEQLPEGPRCEIQELLAISWIPVATAKLLKDNVAALVGLTSHQLQVRVVRAALAQTINVFWRLLLRHLSDAALVKRTPILYSRSFDRGELVTRLIKPGHAQMELSGWPNMPDYDALGLATGIACVLEHSGRKDVATTWSRQGARLIFEASWPSAEAG